MYIRTSFVCSTLRVILQGFVTQNTTGLYKMRIKYADAMHISCAYRLQSPQGPYQQEYFDDGQPGAGRAILQALKDRVSTCTAVYITHYYGGIKLGKRRFEKVSMLTTAAISKMQYKMRARRGERRERALSQESIQSSIVSMSEDDTDDPADYVQRPDRQESMVSMDEHFSSATEGV